MSVCVCCEFMCVGVIEFPNILLTVFVYEPFWECKCFKTVPNINKAYTDLKLQMVYCPKLTIVWVEIIVSDFCFVLSKSVSFVCVVRVNLCLSPPYQNTNKPRL